MMKDKRVNWKKRLRFIYEVFTTLPSGMAIESPEGFLRHYCVCFRKISLARMQRLDWRKEAKEGNQLRKTITIAE